MDEEKYTVARTIDGGIFIFALPLKTVRYKADLKQHWIPDIDGEIVRSTSIVSLAELSKQELEELINETGDEWLM